MCYVDLTATLAYTTSGEPNCQHLKFKIHHQLKFNILLIHPHLDAYPKFWQCKEANLSALVNYKKTKIHHVRFTLEWCMATRNINKYVDSITIATPL